MPTPGHRDQPPRPALFPPPSRLLTVPSCELTPVCENSRRVRSQSERSLQQLTVCKYLAPCSLYLVPCTLYLVPCTLYLVLCWHSIAVIDGVHDGDDAGSKRWPRQEEQTDCRVSSTAVVQQYSRSINSSYQYSIFPTYLYTFPAVVCPHGMLLILYQVCTTCLNTYFRVSLSVDSELGNTTINTQYYLRSSSIIYVHEWIWKSN